MLNYVYEELYILKLIRIFISDNYKIGSMWYYFWNILGFICMAVACLGVGLILLYLRIRIIKKALRKP